MFSRTGPLVQGGSLFERCLEFSNDLTVQGDALLACRIECTCHKQATTNPGHYLDGVCEARVTGISPSISLSPLCLSVSLPDWEHCTAGKAWLAG
jgi:hypothetical protein